MSFYLVDSKSNYPYKKPGHYNFASYTEKGAKIARARLSKGKKVFYVMEAETWNATFNPEVEKTNLMSGKKFMGRKYEPLCTDPSSETYWSM